MGRAGAAPRRLHSMPICLATAHAAAAAPHVEAGDDGVLRGAVLLLLRGDGPRQRGVAGGQAVAVAAGHGRHGRRRVVGPQRVQLGVARVVQNLHLVESGDRAWEGVGLAAGSPGAGGVPADARRVACVGERRGGGRKLRGPASAGAPGCGPEGAHPAAAAAGRRPGRPAAGARREPWLPGAGPFPTTPRQQSVRCSAGGGRREERRAASGVCLRQAASATVCASCARGSAPPPALRLRRHRAQRALGAAAGRRLFDGRPWLGSTPMASNSLRRSQLLLLEKVLVP